MYEEHVNEGNPNSSQVTVDYKGGIFFMPQHNFGCTHLLIKCLFCRYFKFFFACTHLKNCKFCVSESTPKYVVLEYTSRKYRLGKKSLHVKAGSTIFQISHTVTHGVG